MYLCKLVIPLPHLRDLTMLSHCHVWLFATPWTVAHQAPLSLGKNTGVGCHALLQGIFPTQVSHIAGGFFMVWVTREAP